MEKKKKILMGFIIALSCVCVIAVGTIIGVVASHNKHKPTDTIIPSKPETITSSYNEAITSKLLITQNYSGTYVYDSEAGVIINFNQYSEDNPTGLTDAEIQQIYNELAYSGGYTSGYAELCSKMDEKRFSKSKKYNERLEIITKTDIETGEPSKYGDFIFRSDSGDIYGRVYGDDNLAVGVNGVDDKIYIFMSINYNNFKNSIDVAEETTPETNKIYIFEDYYSSSEPTRKLFTVTYSYTKVS